MTPKCVDNQPGAVVGDATCTIVDLRDAVRIRRPCRDVAGSLLAASSVAEPANLSLEIATTNGRFGPKCATVQAAVPTGPLLRRK
jgi:hypothetical protein